MKFKTKHYTAPQVVCSYYEHLTNMIFDFIPKYREPIEEAKNN